MEAFKYSIVIVDAHTSAESLGPRGLAKDWRLCGDAWAISLMHHTGMAAAGFVRAVLPVSYQADLCCKLS